MLANEIQSDEEIDLVSYYFEDKKEPPKQKRHINDDGYPCYDYKP